MWRNNRHFSGNDEIFMTSCGGAVADSSQVIPVDYAESYADEGFLVLRGVLDDAFFDLFEQAFLELVAVFTGRRFRRLDDRALCDLLDANRKLESQVYNAVRALPEMTTLAADQRLTGLLQLATPERRYGLLEKMILRIDLTNCEEEVAHWHQDHFYVRGNAQTITAWIPLQDVDVSNGCLAVAPGSHGLGAIAPDRQIGKRHCPAEALLSTLEVERVSMQRGDVLLFHALLLHSGRVNRSEKIRYSFQFRYSPLGLPTDPAMGGLVPLEGRRDD